MYESGDPAGKIWRSAFNQLGSNDFRSTRRNIWYAGLQDVEGQSRVTVVSDGRQHWRSWKEGEKTCFLVADFVTAGDEMFLGSHYAPYWKPLKVGDVIILQPFSRHWMSLTFA